MMRKVILDIAEGDYIAFQNSDDIWESNKLQKQVDFLDTHPNIGAVFTKVLIIGENSEPLKEKGDFIMGFLINPIEIDMNG